MAGQRNPLSTRRRRHPRNPLFPSGQAAGFVFFQRFDLRCAKTGLGRIDHMRALRFLGFAAALAFSTAAPAQELRIGMQNEASSIDPHFQNYGPNNGLNRHLFTALVIMDKDDNFHPGLAESWKPLDEKTWEVKLRKGVKWHDGSPFTADDVVFTWERAKNVPRSPNSFVSYMGTRTVEKVDDHTVLFKAQSADPLLGHNLPHIPIVSAKHGRGATTEDYNSGKAAVGTGPYKFVEFVPGDRVVIVRNEEYWGEKPHWQRVVFRTIPNDVTRVATLLSGGVDMIENIPTSDVARLKADPQTRVFSALATRMMYLHLDRHRQTSPHILAKDGSPIPNPLHDLKVRQALSAAINRQAIVERMMEGEAEPAAQFLDPRYPGSSTRLKPEKQDLAKARRLLTEAGFPNGFRMTIHGPVNRYPNDTKVLEAIAQMFTRVGVDTKVETLPPANYFSRASAGGPGGIPEFSVIFAGGGTNTAEPSTALIPLILSFNREKATGAANRGRYSNPKVDEMVLKAITIMDDKTRNAMLAEATEIAFEDVGMIPLYFVNNTWAARRPIVVEARTDEYTLAMGVQPR
jgi:peptide/nickel transport system substrate-binding protein